MMQQLKNNWREIHSISQELEYPAQPAIIERHHRPTTDHQPQTMPRHSESCVAEGGGVLQAMSFLCLSVVTNYLTTLFSSSSSPPPPPLPPLAVDELQEVVPLSHWSNLWSPLYVCPSREGCRPGAQDASR
ncbi:hypothetical protein E2C01_035909 [Portunus trituberculatus]|uniref:Uncharacterized protein n=1 Tax=Portunus trituberculatus TaxID=210409 RepID=A0A5B7F4E4_PORTR|nr:hypothetical protein [Portunus trituberculatus]